MTVRVGIAGITGRMGREIAALAAEDPEFDVAGGLGRRLEPSAGPGAPRVLNEVTTLLPGIDVLIDFTSPEGAVAHARACAAAGVAMVSGTSGLDDTQLGELRAAADRIALFHAANMSPATNVVLALLPDLVRALPGYDVEIIETHHRRKADAPSGTALALARAAAEARSSERPFVERARYGRHGASLPEPEEMGIHAVRSGGNPGEHTVLLAGDGEEVRLTIRAFNRTAYAQGALRAARLIADQPPGWYEPATLPGFL
jgi:4-hydroxy-tetrahydrodipicolinate reductase